MSGGIKLIQRFKIQKFKIMEVKVLFAHKILALNFMVFFEIFGCL